MHPARSEPEEHVAHRHAGRQRATPLHGAHREAGEIEITAGVHPRHLGRLAADQRRPCLGAAGGDPADDLRRGIDLQLAGGKIVEEEQRFGALADEVVHAHGHEVDPDAREAPRLDRQPELRPDPVRRRNQHRVRVARGLQVEERAEAAEPRHHPRSRRGRRRRLDAIHQRVARIDVDAGLRIGQPVRPMGHACPPLRMLARSSSATDGPREHALDAREPPAIARCPRARSSTVRAERS